MLGGTMTENNRVTLTIGLWFLSAGVLVALFLSAAAQNELTTAHIVFAFTLLALAIAGTVFLFRGANSENEQEKTKRHRIDRVLSDMSDEELMELKQRLSDRDFNAGTSLASLGDDGEMLRRS
jgi:choline-glycine betaine transporter